MSIARRLLLMLLVLCLPLQSALALAGTPCRSMQASSSMPAMAMMHGQHDHAAMMLAAQQGVSQQHDVSQQANALHQHNTAHDHSQTGKHPMSGCEHCAHCPMCSLSTGINAIFTQPILHTVAPVTPHVAEAWVSLILDTPQRPPQAA